jgi:hypothetical protein
MIMELIGLILSFIFLSYSLGWIVGRVCFCIPKEKSFKTHQSDQPLSLQLTNNQQFEILE